jgi:Sortase domain
MTPRGQVGGRRGVIVAAVAGLLALVGIGLVAAGVRGSDGPPPVADALVHTSTAPSALDHEGADLGPVMAGSPPVALDIPRIDVHSKNIVDLGLAKDGSIEVPRDYSAPGWFTPGPSPGQFGPAVIAGHVDSKTGPAVFYRLGELRRGDRVRVTREDGSVASFVIDRVKQYEKDKFPTRAVYGNSTNRAELRLITCGGQYDKKAGYLSNIVAFAHLSA